MPVRKRSLYLTKATLFNELELFNTRSHYSHLHRHDIAALTNRQTTLAGIDSKLPSFQAPKFDGNTIERDAWARNVVRKFKGQGQLSFLECENHCTNQSAWSEVFSSRLLNSITDNDVLGYMAKELVGEVNCYCVWEKISLCLQTSDLKISRVLSHWTKLFSLRCNTRDEFFPFYSKV